MEHKYNQLSLERYSASLAKLLCDRYFAGAARVSGQQLIGFMPVKQVNLFLIKELLLRWNQEMANLKSPYFDYDQEEVKEALVQFMNVLSRKIAIKRPHFEPLLVKAITDTFRWVLDPVPVFEEKFLQVQEDITVAKLQSHLKYISLSKELVQGFLDQLGSGSLSYNRVLDDFRTYVSARKAEWTSEDSLFAEFNTVLPIQKEDILSKVNAPANSPAVPIAERPYSSPTTPIPKPEPASVPVDNFQKLSTVPDTNLNEKFRAEKPTLNERLAKPAPTLVDHQMEKKIESLKDSISINQRFGFINELFNGENMQYYNAIKVLDEFKDPDSAKNYVLQDLAPKYNWAKKEEHVNKLLRLIERKFAV